MRAKDGSAMRKASVARETKETAVAVEIGLDGSGQASVATGLPFMDHMLGALARHGHVDLAIQARGDLDVDAHHTMEDVGLVFGQALREALGERQGIRRFGASHVPMDEALARVVIDISGRPCLVYNVRTDASEAGGMHVRLFREFFQALVNTSGLTVHIDLLAGAEVHHCLEAVFKAFGRALAEAAAVDPRHPGVPSTKGRLD